MISQKWNYVLEQCYDEFGVTLYFCIYDKAHIVFLLESLFIPQDHLIPFNQIKKDLLYNWRIIRLNIKLKPCLPNHELFYSDAMHSMILRLIAAGFTRWHFHHCVIFL